MSWKKIIIHGNWKIKTKLIGRKWKIKQILLMKFGLWTGWNRNRINNENKNRMPQNMD